MCWERENVGPNMHVKPKLATFGHVADMSPIFPAKRRPSSLPSSLLCSSHVLLWVRVRVIAVIYIKCKYCVYQISLLHYEIHFLLIGMTIIPLPCFHQMNFIRMTKLIPNQTKFPEERFPQIASCSGPCEYV